MTKEELLDKLQEFEVQSNDNEEGAHHNADFALLEYINDLEITEDFCRIKRWYS